MPDSIHPDSAGRSGRIPRHAPGEFDFDGWSRLAAEDPAAYFDARRHVIEALIGAARDEGGRLRRLQNQIDATRAAAGSPLKAAWQISGLMHDHVELLGHQLDVLQRETDRLRARLRGGASGK